MELALKPDFEQAVERLEAWWHCEVIDRPCIQFTTAKDGDFPPMPDREHATLRDRWMDVEYNVGRAAAGLTRREYIGESFPSYMPNLGPDICAALLGAELEFMPGTSWPEPFVEDWASVDFTPQYDSAYWQTIRDMTALSLDMGEGRFITAITDLHTNGDLLSAIRGREEICLDVMDQPEELRKAIDAVGAARGVHHFLSVTKQGISAIVATTGNDACHIILRGSSQGGNYDAQSVDPLAEELKKADLPHRVMIDFSHGNSQKDHQRQVEVCKDVAEQLTAGSDNIFGVMMESHLVEGRQDLVQGTKPVYGQSITDACISWETTEQLLEELARAVQARRRARS